MPRPRPFPLGPCHRADDLSEIVNLMSADAEKMVFTCLLFHGLWTTPIFLVIAIYLLATLVGPAIAPGIGMLLLTAPIQVGSELGSRLTSWVSPEAPPFMSHKKSNIRTCFECTRLLNKTTLPTTPPPFFTTGLRDLQAEPASEGGDEAFGRARQARERSPSGRARCQVLPLGGESQARTST